MNRSFLFLANGFEEIEALTVVDVMRRAGMDIKTVSIYNTQEVTGAHGIIVKSDLIFNEADFNEPEWLIIPGGMPGASNLAEYAPLVNLLKEHYNTGGKIAAICAAPAVVLYPLGILDGKEATCYPGFEKGLTNTTLRDMPVVVAKNLITANGPASAMKFALSIVAESMGINIAQEISEGMLCNS